jgi:hypothetical protein
MVSLLSRSVVWGAIVSCLSLVCADEAVPTTAFRFQAIQSASLGLWDGSRPVLVYNHGDIRPLGASSGRGRACYFHPVYGLDGEVLSDDFPKDHTYHRGMYFAWPHIKIGDKEYELWTARGELKQVFRRFTRQQIGDKSAELGIENAWVVGDRPVVREQIDLRVVRAEDNARSIDVRATWTPLEQPLTLSGAEGKSYGGFNFRFGSRAKPVITVPASAELLAGVTATAGRVSDDLLMTKLPWADFTGEFQGSQARSGAAIFVHPGHRDFPPTWMARHYGLMSVGWPGVEPQTFPVGEAITCKYRVWIHRGHPTAAEIQAAYDGWREIR